MKLPIMTALIKKIDKALGIEKSERQVGSIKQEATDKIADIQKTLDKNGRLQQQVMRKTTTYYLGKAAGVIK